MKNTDLKKLNRAELLGMLVDLSEENEALRSENETLKQQLESRRIAITKAGSIAEAALALNEIFEMAQRAADQYLENIRRLGEGNDQHETEEQRDPAPDNGTV